MPDALTRYLRQKRKEGAWLPMIELIDGHAYRIDANNAYVGIWIAAERGFVISRYKVGPQPSLFMEYHWDLGADNFGTARPLAPIGPCPLVFTDWRRRRHDPLLTDCLDRLEQAYPLVPCIDTLVQRRQAAIRYARHLAGERPGRDTSSGENHE